MTTFKERAANIGVRAAKTFLQAFIAVEIAAGTGYIDFATAKAAAVAGGAAVLSLAQNLLADTEEQQAKIAADRAYRARG
jgi:hypothetical protein